MAQDATGTPTSPDNIPKYNTAVDAPSGKGFNAAMDAIQTALSTRIDKPSGIVSGEAAVWNGTAWVRSSVTRLSTVRPQDLGQDAATTGQHLEWNGTIWAPKGGVWTAYTPTWASSGTQPAIGNGTLLGRWTQIGKLVVGWAQMTAGSTTTFGTGAYTWGLPTTVRTGHPTPLGVGIALDAETSSFIGRIDLGGALAFAFRIQNATGTYSQDADSAFNVPFTWGTGDIMEANFMYEAA